MKTWLITFFEKDPTYIADHMFVRGSKADAIKAAIKKMATLPPRIYGFHVSPEESGGF